jgi:serine/threonine-protein kinase
LNVSRFQQITPITKYVPDIPGVVNQLLTKAMEFNPKDRIQSAAALHAEVKRTIELLKRGPTKANDDPKAQIGSEYDDDDMPTDEGEGYVVMLIESKAALQNAIRERLKNRGYRVLIIQDPKRALDRFEPEFDPPADCVIFSAAELGSLALDAYNQFASDEHTREIPSILLADRRQTRIISEAKRGPKRKLLALPLKVRELRAALMNVLAGTERRPLGTY